VPGNRRAFCVTLTRAGQKRFAEMAEAHEAWVAECVGNLSSAETEQMMSVLKHIKHDVSRIES
jgi:DNA-binding MarR family transcriptional regulator